METKDRHQEPQEVVVHEVVNIPRDIGFDHRRNVTDNAFSSFGQWLGQRIGRLFKK